MDSSVQATASMEYQGRLLVEMKKKMGRREFLDFTVCKTEKKKTKK